MKQEQAPVLWNRCVAPDIWHMGLQSDGYAKTRAGQFVTLHLVERDTPLLRRPFSIHRCIRDDQGIGGIELLYKVVGRTTRAMMSLGEGDVVDLLGPLGRGFDTRVPETGPVCLVGGGIGLAPLMELAIRLRTAYPDRSLHLFAGGGGRDDLVGLADFKAAGCELHLSTMDGSAGDEGTVILPLERFLKTEETSAIFACGPMPMLRAVAVQARDHGVRCEVSLETMMACGMGACLGCAVSRPDTDTAYFHVCIDGPVFDASVLMEKTPA